MAVKLSYVLTLGVTVLSLFAAVLLFAWRLQPREGAPKRAAALAAVLGVVAAAVMVLPVDALSQNPSTAISYPMQLAAFSALLAGLTALTMWFFDITPWTALFCCTAGYVVQNFASGLTELAWILAGTVAHANMTAADHLVRFAINVACIVAVYVPFYLAFARNISREGLEQVDDKRMLVIMVVVMFGVIGFDLVIKSLTNGGLAASYVMALRASHGLTCVLTYWLDYELLVRRHLEVEQATTERVLIEREAQYQRSRENVEAINIKCHDIRHQIRQLAGSSASLDDEVLSGIAREIDVYDAHVETGNEALDTVLSEKSLACKRAGITLSCVADGAALSFMAPADVYAFFGNALDNAIAAVSSIEPERRSISVVVRESLGVVSIHVENYCADDVAFEDGLPVTTKGDRANHGFGVRSMKNTAERYDGTLSVLVRDGTFHVNVLVPVPVEQGASG